MNCPTCGSSDTKSRGTFRRQDGPVRRFSCKGCGLNFSERTGTPGWHAMVPDSTRGLVLSLLGSGKGVKTAAREAGVHPKTVRRIRRSA